MGSLGKQISSSSQYADIKPVHRLNSDKIYEKADYTEVVDNLSASDRRKLEKAYGDYEGGLVTARSQAWALEIKAMDKYVNKKVKDWEETTIGQSEIDIPGLGGGVIRDETGSFTRDPLAGFPGRGNSKYYEYEVWDENYREFRSGNTSTLREAKKIVQDILLKKYRG